MKKLIICIISLLLLCSCKTSYYMYYEVPSTEFATFVSATDANMAKNKKTPTRVVTAYSDSTGKIVYLMETKITD